MRERAGNIHYQAVAANPDAEYVQTGPEAHPASYTMGSGSFPGVTGPRRDVDHPPPYLAPRLKEK